MSAERFGDEWEGWTSSDHLAALTYETQMFLLHTLKQVNSEKTIKPVPEPLNLPGRKSKQKKNQWADMLARAKQFEQHQ